MSLAVPQGFRLAGVYCGIKRNTSKLDLSLIVSDRPAVAAGVYTQNLVFAAPVALDRARTPSEQIRAVVINSGNANACTGERGLTRRRDDGPAGGRRLCGAAGSRCWCCRPASSASSCRWTRSPPASTRPPRSSAADEDVARRRRPRHDDHRHAAQARRPRARRSAAGRSQITGMAKGAAMIGPNMATMLGVVLTDAPLDAADAQQAARRRRRRDVQLHQRRRAHEHQRHRAAAGQRRRRRRRRSRAPTWRRSAGARAKSAPSWPRRFPPTAKAPRT